MRSRRAAGFTLVEVLLGTFLMVMLAVISLTLMTGQRRQTQLSAAYVRDVSETRRALAVIERDLRVASASRTTDGFVRLSVAGAEVVYWTDGRVLWRKTGGRTERLHSNLESVEFVADGPLTHVTLTLGQRARRDGRRARVETTVLRRTRGQG